MKVVRDSSQIPPGLRGCVVALGNFDGLHLGHQAVIGTAAKLAAVHKKPLAVMTFEPHPRRFFKPGLPPLRIYPFAEKMRLLAAMKIEFLRIARFTRRFSEIQAEEFISQSLAKELGASHVVTGDDFVFGHKRSGNAEFLRATGTRNAMSVTACPQVEVDGARCSSTRIRQLLSEGRPEEAAKLLGRPYSISGKVRQGDKRGRTLGFPTANLIPGPIFMPSLGVYAVRARVAGKTINGVASLGLSPTVGHTRVRLETHLFDFNDDIYGAHIEVQLLHYLRAEQKFDGLESLKAQMALDSEKACGLLELP